MDKSPDCRGNVLTPASTSSLNCQPSGEQKSRKRKWLDIEGSDHPPHLFYAKAVSSTHGQNEYEHTASFKPIALLERAQLPLIWLDTNPSINHIPPGWLFRAKIQSLASFDEDVLQTRVLIALLYPKGGLFAVESVAANTYIACHLRQWITENQVLRQAKNEKTENDYERLLASRNDSKTPKVQLQLSSRSGTSRSAAATDLKVPKNRRGVLARKSILPAALAAVAATSTIAMPSSTEPWIFPSHGAVSLVGIADARANEHHPGSDDFHAIDQNQEQGIVQLRQDERVKSNGNVSSATDAVASPNTEVTVQEDFTLEMLRKQYLETLYLSKTSLAYFAKGPMSRVRTYYQSPKSETLSADLIEFYRDSIIAPKKIDLKYRETIPIKLEEVSQSCTAANGDGTQQTTPTPRGRKASKRKKMGKDCLYSGEEEYISRWWQERPVNVVTGISTLQSDETKKMIAELRTRETEMQLLLVLEVLALEMPSRDLQKSTKGSAVKEEPAEENDNLKLSTVPTVRKKRDLSSDLDMCIERLCIWHTIEAGELLGSPEKTRSQEQDSSRVKDKLRDFCTDVIIPFYGSRLPEICKVVCRKLGGSENPPARTTAPRAGPQPRLLPGAAIKSRPRPLHRRTLERVLSEDHGLRHGSPPAASRSSTALSIPKLIREPSETYQRPGSRSAMHKSVSFSNREIDLVADVKAQTAKRKKLEKHFEKRDLDAAIAALKKPNRRAAATDFMNEVEGRAADSQKQLIYTTPKKLGFGGRQSQPRPAPLPSAVLQPTQDDEPVIPSSTVKPRAETPGNTSKSSAKRQAVLTAIHETPLRGASRTLDAFNLPFQQLVLAPMPTVVTATPATHRVCNDTAVNSTSHVLNTPVAAKMTQSRKPVLFTSVKKTDVTVENVFKDAPIIPADAGKAMDRVMGGKAASGTLSIYDRLGWNDDIDELA